MKRFLTLAVLGAFAAFAAPSYAQGTAAPAPAPKAAPAAAPAMAPAAAPAANPQQERMKDCNAKATGKTGDARKTFMSSCLSGKAPEPAVKMTQQEKMTACNKKAGDMKGDERKKFMSTCLKG